MVCHDQNQKILIPFYEFVACSLSSTVISRYLIFLKKTMDNLLNNDSFKNAPIIVTDEAWSHINALCEVFNCINVSQYFEVCYRLILSEHDEDSYALYNNSIKTIIYLCSTHYLKNLIKEIKVKVTINVRKSFIFAFTLLQQSTDISEFVDHLDQIYYLFNQPYQNKNTFLARNKLTESVLERKITNLPPPSNEMPKGSSDSDDNDLLLVSDEKIKLLTKSKFAIYFEQRIQHYKELVDDLKTDNQITNEYYNPSLFSLISKRLHLVPLWSGLMLGHFHKKNPFYGNFQHLSNNPVENWFKILKRDILGGQKKVIRKKIIVIRYLKLFLFIYPFNYQKGNAK